MQSMKILITSIGRRGYLADYFRQACSGECEVLGTTDRHDIERELTVGLRVCDRGYLVPPVASDSYIDSVLEICRKEHVSLLCSALDVDNEVLAQHRGEFEALGVTPFVSRSEVNRICLDKYLTHEFLCANGFASPATYTSLEECLASEQHFPMILKPRFGCASEGLMVVKNRRVLEVMFEPGVHVIQQFIAGQEFGVDLFNDSEGRLLAYAARRKLRMRAGETDQAITVKEPLLERLTQDVSRSLKHFGPLDMDVMVRDGVPYVIDFNPRFGGGYPLSHAAGIDFPQLMVDITLGRQPRVNVGDYREGLVMMKEVLPVVCDIATLQDMIQ